ncbi:mitochondrial phosphate carrier protein 3, mitochondrial-like [Actinidia eriantha]|uniref:mitochondrial phosphate carrier protein 3, mitochondrial-like n=1 Tax=Actinidia eriantha TaxID=165200 RepID=UPI002589CDFC|nr:mitochondrial phosphate carrier protein 3, mitochondrial-like [Actinidia eriantha]
MALSDYSRESLIPSFLYSAASPSKKLFDLEHLALNRNPMLKISSSSGSVPVSRSSSMKRSFVIPAPSEPGKIEMYSPAYFAACGASGMLSTGLTHTAVTPMDVVKCNMQIDPVKYKSVISGFGVLVKEQGIQGLFRGWVPTLLGYSAQGACKFGFYEYFKYYYSDIVGPEYATKYKTLIYLAGSASAEVIADVALCPFEAVKVRVQTQPGFAKGLSDGLPKFVKSEGALGLYKGIVPLWGRQIPYTMMKFASFETIVELMYKHVIPTPKEECSKTFQLGLSFVGGYIAGIFCAIVSHPADNLVSFLNNAEGATVRDAVNKLGVWGLFTRGLPLRIAMIGTLTGAQWGLYDAFKVAFGLPTTGGITPPATVPEKM